MRRSSGYGGSFEYPDTCFGSGVSVLGAQAAYLPGLSYYSNSGPPPACGCCGTCSMCNGHKIGPESGGSAQDLADALARATSVQVDGRASLAAGRTGLTDFATGYAGFDYLCRPSGLDTVCSSVAGTPPSAEQDIDTLGLERVDTRGVDIGRSFRQFPTSPLATSRAF
ncbi:unnamed protein product, partial [Protopolystoma xenopodis]